ncbi:AraC family transcriptional regulator [uncultured Eudoraea sp.]|uniref:AraC family transcriptional regulator n=1 Tax=uncultured Eudoraea sp. TaxID=1035614 RepID=UPI00262E449E|nr:AraC family transcriptional regulator [uncultured Eudoraea sp.]
MEHLTKGKYFGDIKNVIQIDNLILTETEFTGSHVDWHCHENMHFSYSLIGNSCQISKKEKQIISNGTLIYHNSEDSHFNTKHSKYSKNFYIEIEDVWFRNLYFQHNLPKGVINLKSPRIKTAIEQIYLETKINDSTSKIAIESILINTFHLLQETSDIEKSIKPKWVSIVKEIIHEYPNNNFSLNELSKKAEIHPVHLSREFLKYFGQSLSQYIRTIKVHKAASLLKNKDLSLMDICFYSGFSDQSHMSKCFKNTFNITPFQYRKVTVL